MLNNDRKTSWRTGRSKRWQGFRPGETFLAARSPIFNLSIHRAAGQGFRGVVHEAEEGLGEGFLVETEGVAAQGDLDGAPQEVEAAGVEVAVDSEVHENAATCITVYSMCFANLHGLRDCMIEQLSPPGN